jgi:hypothetical protein
MSTTALKRELALLRSSLAALTPSHSATLDDPIVWAERSPPKHEAWDRSGLSGVPCRNAPTRCQN